VDVVTEIVLNVYKQSVIDRCTV